MVFKNGFSLGLAKTHPWEQLVKNRFLKHVLRPGFSRLHEDGGSTYDANGRRAIGKQRRCSVRIISYRRDRPVRALPPTAVCAFRHGDAGWASFPAVIWVMAPGRFRLFTLGGL